MKALIIFIAIVGIAFAQGQQGEQGPPPFLVGAPANVVDEFKQLVNGAPDKTDAEVDRDIENWIARQGPKVKTEFNKFKTQMQQGKARAEAAHRASIARFSPAAKAADAQLTAIADNPNLKGREKQQKITSLLQSLPAAVQAELQKEMQG